MLIRIMACKEREDNINKMLSSLPSKTECIWDMDHNPCHTLQRVVDSNEAMLVMEDDIELCKNFYEKAIVEIRKRPKSFIMFYSAWAGDICEAHNKERWKPYNRPFVFTQAYYIPEWIGKKLKTFLEINRYANSHRWSVGINQFLVQEWIERYLVRPSLVQHIGTDSINEPNKFPMHQSPTYKYWDDLPKNIKKMKFTYTPGKEEYTDYLKKLMWVKKKKNSKKKEKDDEKEEIEVLSLDELNR